MERLLDAELGGRDANPLNPAVNDAALDQLVRRVGTREGAGPGGGASPRPGHPPARLAWGAARVCSRTIDVGALMGVGRRGLAVASREQRANRADDSEDD